jgi:hypothetical protein
VEEGARGMSMSMVSCSEVLAETGVDPELILSGLGVPLVGGCAGGGVVTGVSSLSFSTSSCGYVRRERGR